jgi:DNA polymerase-1
VPRVPDRSWYDPVLDATLHTGDNAVSKVNDLYCSRPRRIAIDIETPGLDRSFVINCVTAAWIEGPGVQVVLLDPARDGLHHNKVRDIMERAASVVLHNAPFDIPALYHHNLITAAEINRVTDTLLLARMAWPNPYDTETGKRDLTSLATRLLGMEDFDKGMTLAFKAAGFKTKQAGYEGMDIDSPIYRRGAMADTVATLRLEPIVRQYARQRLTDHGLPSGAHSDHEADQIIAVQETVNRVMLRRTARGINVDSDYLTRYAEQVDSDRTKARETLSAAGLDGGVGKSAALVGYLDSIGELPPNWKRTETGKLAATKELLTGLDHPLADAQRRLAETDKVLGYLDKVYRQSLVTGRCHPQIGVLGASQTGRMSCSAPELQQFPKEARPILIADHELGLSSIDWSQIEPVTMGLLARDEKFLADYEAGEDLYGPIQTAAGIDRTLAKVVLLATMYGQGITGLAKRIGKHENDAAQIRRQMLDAMPECKRWMANVQAYAEQFGVVMTAAGRVLPVDSGGAFRAVNYVVQGSAYDVLAHSICEAERQGLGDHIVLAMHDELVVDTVVAEEVQRIMTTPPPWLAEWAGRTPTLRTDREDMGPTWLKV